MDILKICLTLCIFLFGPSCSDNNKKITAVDDKPTVTFRCLSTEGNKIVDEDGNLVLLHGVNRSGLEYDKYGNNMNEAEFQYICKEWQANVIRIPFNQEWVMTDEDYNTQLDTVINWIKKCGAYVILDLQWQNTSVKIPPIPDTAAVDMWKRLAERYKNDPAILYDIHNEAHDISFEKWQNRAIEIIEGIRSVHPRSLILVSGLDWASDLTAWATFPLSFDNIIYSVHVYPWMGSQESWDYNFGNYTNQIPIFVGELGGGPEDITWGRKLIAYLNQKQLGWTAWSWVDEPHLTQYDRRTPTEFGSIVQESLIQLAFPEEYANNVYDIKIEYITANRATINWKTTNDSDSKVVYGLTEVYTESVYAPIKLKSHTIKLTDLLPDTTYHFKVISVDDFGFVGESSDSTFSTLP